MWYYSHVRAIVNFCHAHMTAVPFTYYLLCVFILVIIHKCLALVKHSLVRTIIRRGWEYGNAYREPEALRPSTTGLTATRVCGHVKTLWN